MTLAATVYTPSNSSTREQPYQPHRLSSATSKEPWEKRSPRRLVTVETNSFDRSRVYALRFGRFRLVLHSRELLAAGVPLCVGNRALDVLFALIEARGELVTKDELLIRVWPNTTVEENNLQFQVSTLRKLLGEDRDLIRTVSGRGYRFIAEITAEYRPPHPSMENAALDEHDAATSHGRDLSDSDDPAQPAPDIVEADRKNLGAETAANRLVTLAGAEGIEKMRLAFERARRAVPTFANGIVVAECGRVLDPGLATATVVPASKLNRVSNSPECTTASFNSGHLLLLLDSCEHILETVTAVAEALLQANGQTANHCSKP
jgi:non-specific serine/threonine protein kinase